MNKKEEEAFEKWLDENTFPEDKALSKRIIVLHRMYRAVTSSMKQATQLIAAHLAVVKSDATA